MNSLARKRNGGYFLRSEQLEDRRLLAGDVTISLEDGALSVIGTGGSDYIEAYASSTTLSIYCYDFETEEETCAPTDVPLADIDSVDVKLLSGDDTLSVYGDTEAPEDYVLPDVTINTSFGNDQIYLDNITVVTLNLRTGADDDYVGLYNTLIDGNLVASTAGGADSIDLSFVYVSGTTSIAAATENDTLSIFGSTFERRFIANMGAGNDVVYVGGLLLGRGDEYFTEYFGDDARFVLSDGNDEMFISFAEISGLLAVNGGADFDCLFVFGPVSAGSMVSFQFECDEVLLGDDVDDEDEADADDKKSAVVDKVFAQPGEMLL